MFMCILLTLQHLLKQRRIISVKNLQITLVRSDAKDKLLYLWMLVSDNPDSEMFMSANESGKQPDKLC